MRPTGLLLRVEGLLPFSSSSSSISYVLFSYPSPYTSSLLPHLPIGSSFSDPCNLKKNKTLVSLFLSFFLDLQMRSMLDL